MCSCPWTASRWLFSVIWRPLRYINQSKHGLMLVWLMTYLKRNPKWGHELLSVSTALEPNGKFWEANFHHGQNSAPCGVGTEAPIPLLVVSSASRVWLIPGHVRLHLQASSWVGSFFCLNLGLPLLPPAEKIICSSKIHVVRSNTTG